MVPPSMSGHTTFLFCFSKKTKISQAGEHTKQKFQKQGRYAPLAPFIYAPVNK
jgi:hypothetical protein